MIEITSEQIERINTLLSTVKGGASKVVKKAIKSGQKVTQRETERSIKEVYDISAKNLKTHKRVKLWTKQSNGDIIGHVSFSGYKIPLFKFKATPKKSGKRKLVKARQKKNEAMTPFAHAFITTMSSGHTGIFKRKGEARFPISEIMGSSVGQMARDEKIVPKVEAKVQETVNEAIESEINRILNKAWG